MTEMGAVCRLLRVFLVVVLFQCPVTVLGAHGEEDDHGGPLEDLKDYLLEIEIEELQESGKSNENITYGDTVVLVKYLLDRFECHEELGEDGACLACANNLTDHVYRTFEVPQSPGLSEELFQEATVVLLYLVTREDIFEACDSEEPRQGNIEAYIAELSGTDGALSEEELDTLLDEISHTYHSSSRSKCFDVEAVFEAEVADHENGATKEELFHISSAIITNLLQGYCIGTPDQTDPSSFLDNIFDKYGHDGIITEEHFEEILEMLSIGGDVGSDNGHDTHGHAKRSTGSRGTDDRLRKREVEDGHDHGHQEETNNIDIADIDTECFTGEELLDIFGVDHGTGVNEVQFTEMCPAFIQQVLSNACVGHIEKFEKLASPLAWVYGSISVLIISLGSLTGGLFIPCMSAEVYQKFVHSTIALAVAVLTGDAVIHLIPLAYGIHGHDAGGHVVHSPFDPELSYVWKSLLVVVSIYGFYLLETCLGWVSGHRHAHGHVTNMHMTQTYSVDSSRKRESQAELTRNIDAADADFSSGKGRCLLKHGPLPMMIILGDGLHNFADGLALGAAFTAGLGSGISTSIAILCHEVPHELGDLAILLKAGLKLKWALFLNFLSALTAFAGLYLGILLASTEVARQWIFAVTAGMFLYIALVDMMPQITHLKNVKNPVLTFILQNVCFILGAAFIFLLALYEDAIYVQF